MEKNNCCGSVVKRLLPPARSPFNNLKLSPALNDRDNFIRATTAKHTFCRIRVKCA